MATPTKLDENGGIIKLDDDPNFECDCFKEQSSSPRRRRGYIPYSSVYESQDDFRKNGYWIPGLPIDAEIIDVQKDDTSTYHLLNPYIYTIQLEHGKFKWQVKKRYKDFSILSNKLLAHRAVERIKAPLRRTQRHFEDVVNTFYGREHKDTCPYKYARDDDDDKLFREEFYEVTTLSKAPDLAQMTLEEARNQTNTMSSHSSEGNENDALQKTASFGHETKYTPGLRQHNLPHFPMVPDSMVSDDHVQERKEKLEAWLRSVLSIPVNRNYHETAEFLEISRYSFINEIGGKYQEGPLKKRPGGGRVYVGLKQCCVRYFLPWGKRWLVVKDTYCCYMNPNNEQIRLVLLMDEGFEINPKDLQSSLKYNREFIIANQQHILHLKCKQEDEARFWKETIEKVSLTSGQIWLKPKKYGSSFPVRENNLCEWFVDARTYWERAASLMELAREEIFIADWWLCPEIYMKRPMAEGNRWRLDQILKRIAERGVRIFVLLYKEVEMALTIQSIYAKRTLQGLHPNIKVMRHPDHYVGTGTFMWAHHEKLLIIDQLIAFVGGIDLCYGRWDDQRHVLTDLGSIQITPKKSEDFNIANGLAKAVEAATSSMVNDVADKKKPETRHVVQKFLDEHGKEIDENVFILKQEREKEPSKLRASMAKVVKLKKATASGLGGKKEKTIAETPAEDVFEDVTDHGKPAEVQRGGSFQPRDMKNITMIDVPGTSSAEDSDSNIAQTTLKVWKHRPKRSRSAPDDVKIKDKFSAKGKLTLAAFNASHQEVPKGTAMVKVAVMNPNAPQNVHATKLSSSNPLTATESRNRNVVRRVLANLKTNRVKKRWRYALESEDLTEEYIVNYYRAQEARIDMSGLQGAGKLFPGKDYVNYVHRDFVDVQDAFTDFTDRYQIPRMPWHDIHAVTYGETARDIARHFIQRWNATKSEKLKGNNDYPYLLPKSYDWIKVPSVFLTKGTYKTDVQVVRSVSNWSSLIDKTETSIQQAYLSLIANSKHYIYIENQFFVSMINSVDVTNEICKVICERIIRAHRNNEKFRVYILMPLLPGFEGDLKNLQYSALLAVLHYTYLSLSRGPHSLLECLKKAGVDDPWKYISLSALRTYDELCGQLVTELIYIHCKLLIVDDIHTIIGSANINDRSQAGNRDSEVCLVVTDRQFTPGVMDGQPYDCGKFAGSLRKRLMKEHLGLLEGVLHPVEPGIDINVDDPVSDEFFFNVWSKIATDNTKIYEEVFRVIPTDLVESFDELRYWSKEMPMSQYNPEMAKARLKETVGNLVQFPTNFLLKENLSPQITSKEGLVPSSLFT
uniref:Phospholipase n=1 Tax=Panagrolaimus sp. JU765 TaxID=591449 RepID=A0AC34Q529_9BILA